MSATRQLYDFSQHRYYTPNPDIPRVVEFGTTVGAAPDFPSLNETNFTLFGVPSGPWSDGIGGAAEQRQLNDWRPRASISYVTGSHAAKFGYDGGYFAQTRSNRTNSVRLEYRYDTPTSADCLTFAPTAANPYPCGNTSLYYPNDPFNQARRPVPSRVKINTGPSTIDNRVAYSGFYAQDQWTLKRLTLSGGLRYARVSGYPSTCIGTDGNGLFRRQRTLVPAGGGSSAGQRSMHPETDASLPQLSPGGRRMGRVRSGKTSVKWNMAVSAGAAISGYLPPTPPTIVTRTSS